MYTMVCSHVCTHPHAYTHTYTFTHIEKLLLNNLLHLFDNLRIKIHWTKWLVHTGNINTQETEIGKQLDCAKDPIWNKHYIHTLKELCSRFGTVAQWYSILYSTYPVSMRLRSLPSTKAGTQACVCVCLRHIQHVLIFIGNSKIHLFVCLFFKTGFLWVTVLVVLELAL